MAVLTGMMSFEGKLVLEVQPATVLVVVYDMTFSTLPSTSLLAQKAIGNMRPCCA